MKANLPIVCNITEVYNFQNTGPDVFWHNGCFVLIAPDPNAGLKHRYSVIKVDYQSGQAKAIGRELPLGYARKIAKRLSKQK